MFALNLLNLSETETVTFHLSSLLSQAILELEIQDVSFAFSTFSITHHSLVHFAVSGAKHQWMYEKIQLSWANVQFLLFSSTDTLRADGFALS